LKRLAAICGFTGGCDSPRLALDATAIGFPIAIQEIRDRLIELQSSLRYNAWRNLGAGAGVRYFGLNAKDKKDNGSDEFSSHYLGPVIFAEVNF